MPGNEGVTREVPQKYSGSHWTYEADCGDDAYLLTVSTFEWLDLEMNTLNMGVHVSLAGKEFLTERTGEWLLSY